MSSKDRRSTRCPQLVPISLQIIILRQKPGLPRARNSPALRYRDILKVWLDHTFKMSLFGIFRGIFATVWPSVLASVWPSPLGKFGLKVLLFSSGLLLLLTLISYGYSLPSIPLIPFLIAEQSYLYLILPCINTLILMGICVGLVRATIVRATIGRPSIKGLNETGQQLIPFLV